MDSENNHQEQHNDLIHKQIDLHNNDNEGEHHKDENLGDKNANDQSENRFDDIEHQEHRKDSEFLFDHRYDDEDLLRENGDHQSEDLHRQGEEDNHKEDDNVQNEKIQDQSRKEQEDNQSQDDTDREDEEAQEVSAIDLNRDEEPIDASRNNNEQLEIEDTPNQEHQDNQDNLNKEQLDVSEDDKDEDESHKMEEEVDEHQADIHNDNQRSLQINEQAPDEESMQVEEPQQLEEESQPHEDQPQVEEDETQKQVHHTLEVEQPEAELEPVAVTKGRRGRKSKADKSAEPQLAKRQELSEPKEQSKVTRKKSQDSYQPSVDSERGPYTKKHELRHLGQELHRSSDSVIYLAAGPIDPHYFGQCIVKHRLPRKYKGKEAENSSLNKIKQEVNNLTKARNLGVPVPAIYALNIKQRFICLEYFKNHISLKEYLDAKSDNYDDDTIIEMRKLFTTLGNHIADMHNGNVIHGDLSITNVFVDKNKLTLKIIAFGLSSNSGNVEEKAVDLYSFIRSLPATAEEYMRYDDLTHCVYTGYTAKSLKLDAVVQRLQKIKQKLKSQAQQS